MINGLYTSAIGMISQMKKIDVVTNNIANANTIGFKKDNTIIQSFSEQLLKRFDGSLKKTGKVVDEIGKVSYGNFISQVYTDFSNGSLTRTDGIYDIAIDGNGFFSVKFINENNEVVEKYTRDGSFTLNNERKLVTKDGYLVLGENGEITIPDGEFSISSDGSIYCEGEFIDKLKLQNISNTETLRKFGDNLYDATDETEFSGFNGTILQNYLENSNINIVSEMVDMINISRIYEANSKMIHTYDSVLQKAVSEIANKR